MEPPLQTPSTSASAYLERGFRLEQAGTLDRALESYGAALSANPSSTERIEAHIRMARVHRTMANWDPCNAETQEALRLAGEAGDDDLAAEAMNIEVGALQLQGKFDAADEISERALQRARSPRVRGITLQNLGRAAAERRHFDAADRYFSESVAAFRSAGYEQGLAIALVNGARAASDRGDYPRALQLGDEAIGLGRRLNSLSLLLTAVQNQASTLVAQGELDRAEALLTEALGHFTSERNLIRQAECLEIMGQIAESRPDDRETAVRCYERARELAERARDNPLLERLTQHITRLRTERRTDATP